MTSDRRPQKRARPRRESAVGGVVLTALLSTVVTSADGSRLQGECPAVGLIEVFSIEQTTVFRGEVRCESAGSFTAALTLPRGTSALATFVP